MKRRKFIISSILGLLSMPFISKAKTLELSLSKIANIKRCKHTYFRKGKEYYFWTIEPTGKYIDGKHISSEYIAVCGSCGAKRDKDERIYIGSHSTIIEGRYHGNLCRCTLKFFKKSKILDCWFEHPNQYNEIFMKEIYDILDEAKVLLKPKKITISVADMSIERGDDEFNNIICKYLYNPLDNSKFKQLKVARTIKIPFTPKYCYNIEV